MNPAGMAAVFKLVPVSRLLYGSDAPFGSTTVIAAALSKFELAAADITAIRRENALRLFPRSRRDDLSRVVISMTETQA